MNESGDKTMTNADALNLSDDFVAWRLPSRRKVAVACLILTESAMFTISVVAYLYYKSVVGPYTADVLVTPIVSTTCLLASSLTIVIAERAFKRESIGSFRLWWAVTTLLAAICLTLTAVE